MVRTVITGVSGRMGATLARLVRDSGGAHVLAGVTERPDSPFVGRDAGEAARTGALGMPVSGDLEALLRGARADVVVDFTSPEATLAHARVCAAARVPLVVGTTGLSDAQRAELAEIARAAAVVAAPNMSVGVNVVLRAAAQLARLLGEGYDVEVVETHHRMKKDAPSGTALRLAEDVAAALGRTREDLVLAREGQVGARTQREIGVQALRGGDVVGEHTVFFFGEGERVELTHRATSRDQFASGALRAARWAVTQRPGLYDMADVLGLPPLPPPPASARPPDDDPTRYLRFQYARMGQLEQPVMTTLNAASLVGSMTALATPFRDGKFDEAAYRALVEQQVAGGTAVLVPIGTTGEAVTMSAQERFRTVQLAVEAARGRVRVVAGAGAQGTAETVENVRQLREAGADGALVVTPFYTKPTQAGLVEHYRAVARAHPGFPLVAYNVPGRTAVDLLPETVQRLADVPEVVGLKEATASMVRVVDIVERIGTERIALISGDDFTVAPFIALGGKGVISVSSNVAPRMMADLVAASLEGDFARARALQVRMNALHRLLFVEASPIPVKWGLHLLGLFGPELRLPLVPMTEGNTGKLRAEMAKLALL